MIPRYPNPNNPNPTFGAPMPPAQMPVMTPGGGGTGAPLQGTGLPTGQFPINPNPMPPTMPPGMPPAMNPNDPRSLIAKAVFNRFANPMHGNVPQY